MNKRNADEQKDVRSEALFDFVDIDNYVMPTLKMMLGIVNYLCKKMGRKHMRIVKVIPWIMSSQRGYGSYQSTMRQQQRLTKNISGYKWTIRKAIKEESNG